MWLLNTLRKMIYGKTEKEYFSKYVLTELISKVEQKMMDKYMKNILKNQLFHDLFQHFHYDKIQNVHDELFISFRNSINFVKRDENVSCMCSFHDMDDSNVKHNTELHSLISDLSNTMIRQNCTNNCHICVKCYTFLRKNGEYDTCYVCKKPVYNLQRVLNEIQETNLLIMENRNDMNDIEHRIIGLQEKLNTLKDRVDGI